MVQSDEEKKAKKRAYVQRPERRAKVKLNLDKLENKLKKKDYDKEYYFNNQEKIKKFRKEHYINNKLKIQKQKEKYYIYNKEKMNKYMKWYRGKNKKKLSIHMRKRKKDDINFHIVCKLRTLFWVAMRLYSKTGKIMSSRKYNINYEKIMKHLGPVPNDGNIYEADHIIPLCMFDHNDPEQIKKAWSPNNFQWLTKEINQWKSNRLIKPLTNEEKIKLQSELTKNN